MGRKKDKGNDFRITNYGVHDEVTGTCVMVEVGGLKVIMDMGMFQSQTHDIKQIYKFNSGKLKLPLHEIDYVILSHAHNDHVGLLPLLLKQDNGFQGKILCTEPSAPLISMNLTDSAFIQSEQCKFYNKTAKKPLYPLFNMSEAEQMINHLQGYRYNEKIMLNDNVWFEFIPNGHMLGSASVYLTYRKDEYTNKHLLFTGDYNYDPMSSRPFTKKWDKERILKPSVIITEATYGDRLHEYCDVEKKLEEYILEEVVKNKRTLFLPAFAISRSSQLIYHLHNVFERNKELNKLDIPIYMAGKMMARSHSTHENEYYKKNFVDEQFHDGYDCFKWGRVTKIDKFCDVEEKLSNPKKPSIVCVSGGMIVGYSLYLMQQYISNPKIAMLTSGYLAIGSVGRNVVEAVQNGLNTVSIQGKKHQIRMKILDPISMSAHADWKQMVRMMTKSCDGKVLKKVIIIHGNESSKENLKNELLKRKQDVEVVIPKPFSSIKG